MIHIRTDTMVLNGWGRQFVNYQLKKGHHLLQKKKLCWNI
jgi:hypothetical protein